MSRVPGAVRMTTRRLAPGRYQRSDGCGNEVEVFRLEVPGWVGWWLAQGTTNHSDPKRTKAEAVRAADELLAEARRERGGN